MTTFIHAADIHLDSPLYGLSRYEGAPAQEIRQATRKALANLVDYILEHRIPLLLIAGDLYDGDCPDFQTPLHFSAQMSRLREVGTRVAFIRGNHDAQNRMTRALRLPDNVYTFPAARPDTWELEDLGIAVHGQSYDREAVLENLALGYPEPVPGMFNIGMLHTSLYGTPGKSGYAPCDLSHLLAKGYHYWALGHMHRHEVIHRDPPVIFSGCIQGRHIREPMDNGCMRVDLDASGEISIQRLELDVLRWQTMELDISGQHTQGEVLDLVSRELENISTNLDQERLMAVRIILTGASAACSEIMHDFPGLQAEIRNLATDISGQSIWVEKILNQCTPALDWDELKSSGTALAHLAGYMQELQQDPAMLNSLDLDFTELKAKLAGTGVEMPDMNDPGTRQTYVSRARDIIMTLLARDMSTSDKNS
ncbi:DNA repair exonuclease [Desulfonatronospira sp.]|uniref:metallophosphoesterase family protein n=1 Tax=Desulfonatronospira sp. TaxID=1962951 RepID=UPI0025B95A91|nr:DNA repair exonuclease [Desulfonatronospira sp.]